MCRALNTPVTGGNVSFHNESQQHAIFPTPTIGMLGVIDDLTKTVGNAFTTEGERVMMLGWQREELGGSEYLKTIKGRVTGDAPFIDIDEEVRLQKAIIKAIQGGHVSAAHDTAEGGLLVALAEMTLRNSIGCSVAIEAGHSVGHLFGEAQSRIIVSVKEGQDDALKAIADEFNVPLTFLGTTGGSTMNVSDLINVEVSELNDSYENALPSIMASSLQTV